MQSFVGKGRKINVTIETIIECSSWLVMGVALVIFVSKERIRDAHVIFLFHQVVTWACGIVVVEMKWLDYPIRFFAYASRTSFTFEYFICPALAVLFTLYYPKTHAFIYRLAYAIIFVTILTIAEVIIERYTDLIDYHQWKWYWTWISILTTFYLTRKYYDWFFKRGSIHC